MELRQLQCFLAVVKHGGFGRAAESLHVSQPAVSHSIARLENELGARLFNRVGPGRQVSLTAAGEAFLPSAQLAVDATEQGAMAVAATAELLSGRLDLAALSYFLQPLAAATRDFQRIHPGVVICLHGPAIDEDVIDLVRSGECELGFVTARSAPPDLETQPVAAQQLCAVFPPGSDVPPSTSLAELVEWPLVAPLRNTWARQTFDRVFGEEMLQPRIVAECEFYEGRLELVHAGVGATVGAGSATAVNAWRGLRVAVIPYRLSEVVLLHRPANVSPAAAAFRNLLVFGR